MALGRGRGFLLSKIIGISQQNLMSPDQFKSDTNKVDELSGSGLFMFLVYLVNFVSFYF